MALNIMLFTIAGSLETIIPNGMAATRTVVLRRFQDTTNRIQINEDIRTHKIEDLNRGPFTKEQFRINSIVDVIDGSIPDSIKIQQREKAWFYSSPKFKMQYLGVNPCLPSLTSLGYHKT
ncbi:hypothetical protein L1987_86928 [Smallanthus sonchifolius]|uniref:Uncharacterized protein n=1 Tax=Smallanthus sonchifolius TaxID=185202 RepID=A0ACB8Y0S6_9ASTR|nr:hypothetical protein L1987_86928 [Smallanthus sonchifolius]